MLIGVCSCAAAATLLADQRGRQTRPPAAQQAPRQGDLKPADLAPDFTLEPRDGGPAVTLSSFRSRQPVALVFGSYT
jgi:hypothetical protein